MNYLKLLFIVFLNVSVFHAQNIKTETIQYVNVTFIYGDRAICFDYLVVDSNFYYTDINRTGSYVRCFPQTERFKKIVENEKQYSIAVELETLLKPVDIGEELNFQDTTLKGDFYIIIKDIELKYFIDECKESIPDPINAICAKGTTIYPVNIYAPIRNSKKTDYIIKTIEANEQLFIDFINSPEIYHYGL